MNDGENPKKSILIVDDDETLRNVIAFDFKRRGYSVLLAKDGQEAFDVVKNEPVDAVITDVRMPRKSGVELLESIKEVNHKIPVLIFVTGFSDLSVEDAYDKGAFSVMSKPFDRKELIKSIERSMLRNMEKLARPLEATSAELKVELKIQSIKKDALEEEKLIRLGQGGMFISLDRNFPEIGNTVSFKIEHAENSLLLLQGQGVVRWVRPDSNTGFPTGVGVEFIFLDESCRRKAIELLERLQVKSFIPKAA